MLPADGALRQSMAELDRLLGELEASGDERIQGPARQLTQVVLEVHRLGLSALVQRLSAAGPVGQGLLSDLGRDPATSALLLLHDLHPLDTRARVDLALEKLRPQLGAHGGGVRLVGLEMGAAGPVVRLVLEGSCRGCPMSAETLRGQVQTALLELAPEIVELVVTEDRAPELPGPPVVFERCVSTEAS